MIKQRLVKKGDMIVPSIKQKAEAWLFQNIETLRLYRDSTIYFPLVGFADEPKIYISLSNQELEIGYIKDIWYSPCSPEPTKYRKHVMYMTDHLSVEDQTEQILGLLLKTIQSRKRQYRSCLFCGIKVNPEHRYDKDTCHGCATYHYGIKY
ncbi:hypothetical protein [Rossellomorea marisflavi]|nr:hypothetical protein [Rossellomorea marisflavi]KML03170.1 hypothetical protein VL06_16155 [Rossellomorea marisflavi]